MKIRKLLEREKYWIYTLINNGTDLCNEMLDSMYPWSEEDKKLSVTDINLENKKFGNLIGIKFQEKDELQGNLWLCQCTCGNYTVIPAFRLLNNSVHYCKSCVLQFRPDWK